MASRTTTKTSPSRRGRSSSRSSPKRRPASRSRARSRSRAGLGPAVGRGLAGVWSVLVSGAGRMARAAGKARKLDPAHRRDGVALVLVALAVVAVAGVWWAAGGPLGDGVRRGLRAAIGSAAVLLPVVLAAVAVAMMRTEPDPDSRPRRVVGSLLLALGTLGLWHVAAGAPQDAAGRAGAAGAVGFLAADPLSDGFTVWVAVPLLVLLAVYGLLVLTGTAVRAVPDRLCGLIGR
ncbi:MAG: DNA translocase FtsK 4TM domain-containing protein, partial [Pseudonocardiaceae bacterium]